MGFSPFPPGLRPPPPPPSPTLVVRYIVKSTCPVWCGGLWGFPDGGSDGEHATGTLWKHPCHILVKKTRRRRRCSTAPSSLSFPSTSLPSFCLLLSWWHRQVSSSLQALPWSLYYGSVVEWQWFRSVNSVEGLEVLLLHNRSGRVWVH